MIERTLEASRLMAAARDLGPHIVEFRDEIDRQRCLPASAGETITMEQRAAVRLACAQASEATKSVVQTTHDLGGGTSVYESSPLQRCFRDAHAAAQHIQVQSGHFETVGRFILGLDPGPTF